MRTSRPRLRIVLICCALLLAELLLPQQATAVRLAITGRMLPLRSVAAAAPSAAAEPAEAHIALLALDERRSRAIAAAGSVQGVQIGAEVTSDGVLVGMVDAVLPALCRVQMLGSRGLRLPVMLSRDTAGTAQQLGIGVLVAEGGRLELVSVARPDRLRAGDLVSVLREGAHQGTRIGVVEVEGVRPVVARDAPLLTAGVDISGVRGGADLSALYSRVALTGLRAPCGPDGVMLLRLAEASVQAGALVADSSGACVGLIEQAGAGFATARPVHGLTQPLAVRLCGTGWEAEAQLRADESGAVSVHCDAQLPREATAAELRTAAGVGLMPRGLSVGSVILAAGSIVRWIPPAAAHAAVVHEFSDRAALARLMEAP